MLGKWAMLPTEPSWGTWCHPQVPCVSSLPLCRGLPNEAGSWPQMSEWPPWAVQYQISKQISARSDDIVGVNRIPHMLGSPVCGSGVVCCKVAPGCGILGAG